MQHTRAHQPANGLGCAPGFLCEDARSSFIGASFDFKAARKQVQVHPSERGLLLFRFANTLFQYRVWARFSCLLVAPELFCFVCCTASWPTTRRELGCSWLAALRRTIAHERLALIVVFFAAISAPISEKRCSSRTHSPGVGGTIELTPVKTMKLTEQLRVLLLSGKVKRKLLEQVLGLLIWATSLSLELRAWLAPLYSDLRLRAA